MMPNPLQDLCVDVENAIAALDGSEWATTSLTSPTWRPSKQHLDAVDSALASHLLFSVSVESAPTTGEVGPGLLQVAPRLEVHFLFKAGAGEKIARERLAMGAARQVMEAVISYPRLVVRNVECVDFFTPRAARGDFLPVMQTYACLVDIPYQPPGRL